MADAVTSQTIYDGPGELVMKFTNVSDGTGEAAVLKVDVSTFTPAAVEVVIERIVYSTFGMGVDILWDATTDVLAWHLAQDTAGELNFAALPSRIGIGNNSGAGKTGDILFTTVGHTLGDRYSIMLFMRKRAT